MVHTSNFPMVKKGFSRDSALTVHNGAQSGSAPAWHSVIVQHFCQRCTVHSREKRRKIFFFFLCCAPCTVPQNPVKIRCAKPGSWWTVHRCAPLCTVSAESLLNPLFYNGKMGSVHRQISIYRRLPSLIPYFTMGKSMAGQSLFMSPARHSVIQWLRQPAWGRPQAGRRSASCYDSDFWKSSNYRVSLCRQKFGTATWRLPVAPVALLETRVWCLSDKSATLQKRANRFSERQFLHAGLIEF